ncbi:MAG: polysaccharide pyruvyl transferase family protein [Bacteroidaceae bacterium]|nr:polysaccharide pyruvyl transferase family protein [Bacteroidaceae bacterium]
MKIRTITCHKVVNYGASLQALALQTYLTQAGHDVKIIDYTPAYNKLYDIWSISPKSHLYKLAQYFYVVKALCAFKSYLQMRPTRGRHKAFADFTDKYLKLTENYGSYAELVSNPPEADAYVCGSDQIWRTNLNNGKDPAFYLQFGDDKVRRVSYAASFGVPYVTDGMDYLIRLFLSKFDAVSVREASGIDILHGLGVEATLVCDPVFLLSKEEWLKLLGVKERKIAEPYILVYDLNRNIMHKDKKDFVTKYAKEHNLRMVAINDMGNTGFVDVNVNDGGPVDFVNLIAHADFVVSDSFHATAFSCIMHTPFKVFYDSPQSVRIKDYLDIVGLEKCMNTGDLVIDVDWDDVDKRLSSVIYKSKEYLSANLG